MRRVHMMSIFDMLRDNGANIITWADLKKLSHYYETHLVDRRERAKNS